MPKKNFKLELKKIYFNGLGAIKHKNTKYINFLLFNLDQLGDEIKQVDMDNFSLYLLEKEIKNIRMFLIQKSKKIGDK